MSCRLCKQNNYTKWLNKMVYVSGYTKVPRYEYLRSFAKHITKWMKGLGYGMGDRWGDGVKVVVRWMFAIYEQEVIHKNKYGPLLYPEIYHRNLPEDLDKFEMVVSNMEIENFLEKWEDIDDFSQSSPVGIRVRMEMQDFLYTYVNIESSKHGIAVTHLYESLAMEEEMEDEYKSGVDTYLIDVQNGWHR